MGLQTVGHDSHSVYIKNSYNSIKKINWLKTRERIWVEISSKKIQHQTLLLPPDIAKLALFPLWLILFILSVSISLPFPISILDTYESGGSSFRVISFLPFHIYCSWGSHGKNTEVVCHSLLQWRASLVAQLVKNLPAMQETPVWFLGREDLLEKG